MSSGPKENLVDGVIDAVLPKALYRVRLANGTLITASVASAAKRVTVKILPGDRVSVEVSQFDPSRGRIQARQ
ncbi:MAG: translation initiation factor IF-1 [Polyangiaceae bacterium]|nr:translation initiation factor IF-1 [Polyangiaceae bacterium]